MGDAPAAVVLPKIRETIRLAIGEPATLMPEVCDAIVDAALRLWPTAWMTCIAKSRSFKAGETCMHVCDLVEARCREYLEWRYGTATNVCLAIELLLGLVIDELVMWWLESPQHRNAMRLAIQAVRRD